MTGTHVIVSEIPFLATRTTVACPKSVQRRPLTPGEIEAGESRCGVRGESGPVHFSRLPVVTLPISGISWLHVCQRRLATPMITRDEQCGGYNYDSTSIRRPFDCLSKVIKVTVT